jgi:AP-2 complex subunit mu-1
MISAVAIVSRSGEVITFRRYLNNYDSLTFDNYRESVIAAKEVNSPIDMIDHTSFLNHYENELYYVGMTRFNPNAGTILELLARIPKLIKSVLELDPSPNTVKANVPQVIELLDEIIDCGYPQNTDPNALRILTQRKALTKVEIAPSQITLPITGLVSHRLQGIVHKPNEIFVDVNEQVNVLCSASGKVLDSSVNGSILLNSKLSGMPTCKICFNDKVCIEGGNSGVLRSGNSIEVDDMVFHQCVSLTQFANDRAISFIPPDGQFELMHYRKTDSIAIPFTITPMVRELNQNKVEIRINVGSVYDAKLAANPVILKIPLPSNTADVQIESSVGKGKYVVEQNSVLWKITNFTGKSRAGIVIIVKNLSATSKSSSASKITEPISVEFHISTFSSSGLMLQYLKVNEKSGYVPQKWLRYACNAGKYEVRMV